MQAVFIAVIFNDTVVQIFVRGQMQNISSVASGEFPPHVGVSVRLQSFSLSFILTIFSPVRELANLKACSLYIECIYHYLQIERILPNLGRRKTRSKS